MRNRMITVFWLQDLLLSRSISYWKPSIQMFLCPWLVCAGIFLRNTSCPISHTGVRTSWSLQFFRDRGLLVAFRWACIYDNTIRSQWFAKWGEWEKKSLQNTQQKISACLSRQIWFKYFIQHPRKKQNKTKQTHQKTPSGSVDLFVYQKKREKKNLLRVRSAFADWPLQSKLLVLKSVLNHC